MSWLKIDDCFVENEKVLELSDRAFRLHMAALCYCARNLTDGLLTARTVKIVCALTVARRKHIVELRDGDLWVPLNDGYTIKNYLEYNPDAATSKATSRARREAGKRGADQRWGKTDSNGDSPSDSNGDRPPHMPQPVQSPPEDQEQKPVDDLTNGNLEILSYGHALRLYAAIRDGHKDDGTKRVILSYASKLPPAAFEGLREQLEAKRHSIKHEGAWVNKALQKLLEKKEAA